MIRTECFLILLILFRFKYDVINIVLYWQLTFWLRSREKDHMQWCLSLQNIHENKAYMTNSCMLFLNSLHRVDKALISNTVLSCVAICWGQWLITFGTNCITLHCFHFYQLMDIEKTVYQCPFKTTKYTENKSMWKILV